MRFCDWFEAVRRDHGDRGQRHLAQLLGYDPSYVSRLLRGEREPSRQVLERLADAFPLPPPRLLMGYLAAGYVPAAWQALDEHQVACLHVITQAFLAATHDGETRA
jgi:transcriptional regulator with XRE-family HTH domain